MDRFGRHQVRSHSWQEAHEVFETDEETPDLVPVGTFQDADGRQVTVSIHTRDCVGCGVCLARCRAGVFQMCNDKSYLSVDRLGECLLCRECVTYCPIGAIRIETAPAESPVPSEAGGNGETGG
jgi:ferredoxin